MHICPCSLTFGSHLCRGSGVCARLTFVTVTYRMGTQGNKPCHWVHIAAPKSQGTIVLLVQQLQRATNNWSSNLVFYTVNQCSLGYIRAVITGALLVQEFCDL